MTIVTNITPPSTPSTLFIVYNTSLILLIIVGTRFISSPFSTLTPLSTTTSLGNNGEIIHIGTDNLCISSTGTIVTYSGSIRRTTSHPPLSPDNIDVPVGIIRIGNDRIVSSNGFGLYDPIDHYHDITQFHQGTIGATDQDHPPLTTNSSSPRSSLTTASAPTNEQIR